MQYLVQCTRTRVARKNFSVMVCLGVHCISLPYTELAHLIVFVLNCFFMGHPFSDHFAVFPITMAISSVPSIWHNEACKLRDDLAEAAMPSNMAGNIKTGDVPLPCLIAGWQHG